MRGSVVTHHWRASWRGHRVTSQCTAGSLHLCRSDRGEKWVAGATAAFLVAALPQLQPDQEAVGQHDRDGMPMEAPPQSTLVLVPPQLPFGFRMGLRNGILTLGIPGQLLRCGGNWQVTPVVLRLPRLAPHGPLPQQPPDMPLPVIPGAPTLYGNKLLAQPSFGAVVVANRTPLPAGEGLQQLVGPLCGPPGCPPTARLEVSQEVGGYRHSRNRPEPSGGGRSTLVLDRAGSARSGSCPPCPGCPGTSVRPRPRSPLAW